MDKEGLTLEQIKEIYAGKIKDTYTLNLAVAMLENYVELLNKLEEKDKEIERLNNKIEELEKENTVLKTLVVNKDHYSYGIR